MYYIEFIEPKPGISQEEFQRGVVADTRRWAEHHPEDELVLNIGRTWRLGPQPAYMSIWKIKDAMVLQRWTEEFQTPEIIKDHAEFSQVATIVEAGLYEDIGAEVW